MPSLSKSTIALTFKFDCDRFLRFRLATKEEKDQLDLDNATYYRPGLELVKISGKRWEAEKYQDLIDLGGNKEILYRLEDVVNPDLGRKAFAPIENIFEILGRDNPPFAIIEGEFEAPATITPNLQEIYKTYGLETVKVRPDILWVRKYDEKTPLVGRREKPPEFVLHVIDVKMAAQPSLRHFVEVTFYALALAEKIWQEGLHERYAVSAEGLVWPGSHDRYAFRNLYAELSAKGDADPLSSALEQTLVAVPYEVYLAQVKQFFDDRLIRVLSRETRDANWHVNPKCQLCDYLKFCGKQAKDSDHLSRIAWITQGQADLLRRNEINTCKELNGAIEQNSAGWQQAKLTSHQLKAEENALFSRTKSLEDNQPVLVKGRICPTMPIWSDMNIYLTVHFDMGSGITFAIGAMKLFFQPGRAKGSPPQVEQKFFVLDNMANNGVTAERERLKELINTLSSWLDEVISYNATVAKKDGIKAHVFFWDQLEINQLGRMVQRHMKDPEIADKLEFELLMKLFPPDDVLPDPEMFRSQPITIIKEVFRTLIGMPIPFDYTLLEIANAFHPPQMPDGKVRKFLAPYGFRWPMTDQIPFERAYELWQNKVFLTKPNGQIYTRDEIYDGLKRALRARLDALSHLVYTLRREHKDLLTLRTEAFTIRPPQPLNVPERSKSLVAFNKINEAVTEIKNRIDRSLPVEEKESKFISIRGLLPVNGTDYDEKLKEVRAATPRLLTRDLIAMSFSSGSRDSRIKEGDFLLAISNEEPPINLDDRWYYHLGMGFQDGVRFLEERGVKEKWLWGASLARFLQVEIAFMDTSSDSPYLILSPANSGLFSIAIDSGILDLQKPMILDSIYQDFTTKRIREAIESVGIYSGKKSKKE